MEVISFNNEFKDQIFNLLNGINNLEIDESIIKKCSILLDEKQEIKGIISYEQFGNIALIRYFIFRRDIELKYLKQLYQGLEQNIKNSFINTVIGIVNANDVKKVFEYIGFIEEDPTLLFFDETNFKKTNYKDSIIYKKVI